MLPKQSKTKQDRCRLVYKLNNNQNEGKSAVGSWWRLAVGKVSACCSYAKNFTIPTWLIRKNSKFTAVGRVSACCSYAKNFTIPTWLIRKDSKFTAVERVSACRSYAKNFTIPTWLIRKDSKFTAVGKVSACSSFCETLPKYVPDGKLVLKQV